MNVLEFDSLYLEFGPKRVLSSIYMKCETGKITALLGRNGSGKSCLMKIVFGALDSDPFLPRSAVILPVSHFM